jgi:hypothetical protein
MSVQFSWTCPTCGRLVPKKVPECRCGFQQADAPPPLPEEALAPEPAATRGGWGLGVIGAIVIVAGALAMVPMLRPTVATAPAPTTATLPAPAAESGAEPAADASCARARRRADALRRHRPRHRPHRWHSRI